MNLTTKQAYEDICNSIVKGRIIHLIGGQDASAILKMNRYCSPFTVWKEKTQGRNPFKSSKAVEIGRSIEEYLIKDFCEEMGFEYVKLEKEDIRAYSKNYPFAVASYDYWGKDPKTKEDYILETKFSDSKHAEEWDNGNIPINYYWQCIHYFMVSETVNTIYLYGLVGTEKYLHVFKREDVKNDINMLIEKESDFFERYILTNNPPAIDASESTATSLDNMKYNGKEISNDKELEGLLEEYDKLDSESKTIEERLKEIKNKIRFKMGDSIRIRTNTHSISMITSSRQTLDTNRLKEEHPEIYNRYQKQTQISFQRITRIGKS